MIVKVTRKGPPNLRPCMQEIVEKSRYYKRCGVCKYSGKHVPHEIAENCNLYQIQDFSREQVCDSYMFYDR